MAILYKFALVVLVVGLAWILSKRLPRSDFAPGRRFRLSGPAVILAWGLGLSVAGSIAAKLTGRNAIHPWPGETSLAYARNVFFRDAGDDSWRFLDLASRHLREANDQPLYQPLLMEQHHKFQYPSTSLLPWDLLRFAFPHRDLSGLAMIVNLLLFPLLPLAGLMAAYLLRDGWIRVTGAPPIENRVGTFLFLVGGIAQALLFYPFTKSLVLGQAQTLMSALAMAAMLLWNRGSHSTSGALVGICCIFKPQWGGSLLWAGLRKKWGFVAGIGIVSAIAIVVGGIRYGFGRFVEYPPVLAYLSRHGEAYYPNQSVNGIINRFLGNGDALQFQSHAFAPYHPLVYWGTFVSGLAMIGFAMWWNRKSPPSSLDLGLSLTLFTMASPIAWEHHYGLLLGVGAAAAPSILATKPLGRATPWILGLTWLLVGQNFPILTELATHPWGSLAMNNLFFGTALLVLMSVMSTSYRPTSTARSDLHPSNGT